MKVYLSGSISSDPQYKEHFKTFRDYLISIVGDNVEIINPAETDDENKAWSEWIIHDLKIIETCDILIVLPGYKRSKGSNIEMLFANGAGLKVMNIYEFIDWYYSTINGGTNECA
jgi:hypothetical protein